MSIGKRILDLRKNLNITQDEFSRRLRINKGTISNLEKDRQKPSEQLLHHISLEYVVSEDWLKTGEGEMFIPPEDVIKQQMARLGERTFLDAVTNILKEHGLAMAAGRQTNRATTGDPELDRLMNTLYDIWATGDEKFKGWIEVQFNRAFPADVIEEAQKKRQETSRQVSAG